MLLAEPGSGVLRDGAVAERYQSGVANRAAEAATSWWHLLSEGTFSEARTPHVQVPSGREAFARSTPLCEARDARGTSSRVVETRREPDTWSREGPKRTLCSTLRD